MNNKRPGMGEQLLRSLLLSFAVMWLISTFFGWPGQKKAEPTATRDPKLEAQATLDNAFKDLAPGRAITAEAAKSEVGALQTAIAANSGDKYAYWARLRSGLLQQYVLKEPAAALKNYDEIINHGTPDAVDAQAIFQKGDWQWFSAKEGTSTSTPLTPTKAEAAATLETLIHRGRGASEYLGTQIYVPKLPAGAKSYDPNALPAQGFAQAKVEVLKGTLENPNPQGILDRINAHYSTTWLNRGMDVLVNAFGGAQRPATSYGLAIIALAILLRVLMQPINRRQYESMKGMAALGPEMKKIQEKYKAKPNDSTEVAREKQMRSFQEVREMQKAHGVNPQMGCALAFVQMPVFFYIINPLMMHYEPKLELVGASFAWIPSLARPEYILLALYGLSMLVSFRLSATPPSGQMDEMQKQMQIMTTWVMPIMLPFFMKGFSSAFILYWMSFNIVSMCFQYWMMKKSDPDRNILKVLLGKSDAPPTPVVATVPPRPKSAQSLKSATSLEKSQADTTKVTKITKVKSLSPDEPVVDVTTNGTNGHANGNGKANGKPEDGRITMSGPEEKGGEANGGSKDSANGNNPNANGNANGSAAQRARRRRRY